MDINLWLWTRISGRGHQSLATGINLWPWESIPGHRQESLAMGINFWPWASIPACGRAVPGRGKAVQAPT